MSADQLSMFADFAHRPRPDLSGLVQYRICLRAPWDPQEPPREQKRHRQPGTAGPAKSCNAVQSAPVEHLKTLLLAALDAEQASDPALQAYGTTFHSVVMRAWGEWGGDVMMGTNVEEAWWQLYEAGEIHFADRWVGTPWRGCSAIPFWSREEMG